MSKARALLAGGALVGLTALPAILIPASASTGSAAPSSSSTSGQSSASTSSSGPLVQVCLTVTPKSVSIGINGQDVVVGPVGVPTSCVATPF